MNIHGEGTHIADPSALVADAESADAIIGFYALRTVAAQSSQEAIATALAIVEQYWRTPRIALLNSASAPKLSVDDVTVLPLWEAIWRKNSGHIFCGPAPN